MTRSQAPSGDNGSSEICTMRIELADSSPLIWRELEVPTAITLKTLREIIQAAMGWCDSHLWEFRIDRKPYGLPMSKEEEDAGWDIEPRREAAKTHLRDVLKPRRTRIDYTYDFGDQWLHHILLSDVRSASPGVLYPRYTAGERNAPPEDCGGIPGFYEALAARADPGHPEHDEMTEWLADYDPNMVDAVWIKLGLDRIARRRSAARARPARKA